MTEQQLSQYDNQESGAEPVADLWRNELQDRLARYKKRRGHRIEGAFTMRFPFPADDIDEVTAPSETETMVTAGSAADFGELMLQKVPGETAAVDWSAEAVAHATDTATEILPPEARPETEELVLESTPAPEFEPEPFVDTIVRPRPKRKVIAFPKHLSVAPETTYRLADPVTSDAPRILDVPEELEAIPTTPFLDGLQFELPNPAAAIDREHVELPFRAITIPRRVIAGLLDVVISGIGVALCGAVAYKILASPPLTKPLFVGLAAGTVVLWAAYQYLFVVYAGKTLGMMAARIRLRTFKGTSPKLRQRRHRVLGFYLSALSLGMGLMWAFVEVDGLCWHDRLSKTYLSESD